MIELLQLFSDCVSWPPYALYAAQGKLVRRNIPFFSGLSSSKVASDSMYSFGLFVRLILFSLFFRGSSTDAFTSGLDLRWIFSSLIVSIGVICALEWSAFVINCHSVKSKAYALPSVLVLAWKFLRRSLVGPGWNRWPEGETCCKIAPYAVARRDPYAVADSPRVACWITGTLGSRLVSLVLFAVGR